MQKTKRNSRNTHSTDAMAHNAPASGLSRPAVKPVQRKPQAVTVGGQPVVQRYTETEDGAKISESGSFAVKNEGKPNSELYVKDGVEITNLKVATFTAGAASEDHPLGMKKVEKTLSMSPEEIRDIHCGDFARHATGKGENVENGTAPPGRSLYTDLTWGIKPDRSGQRSNWGNHYAPVIVTDKGDRGTFETAVRVDHAWFGIYGQARGQTFRIKTVLADIQLAMTRGILDEETGGKLLAAVKEYIRTGNRTVEDDQYLQEELNAIAAMEGKDPDIDEKFRAEEERKRLDAEREKREVDELWVLFRDQDVATVWEELKKMNPSILKFGLLDKIVTRANTEDRKDILPKIERCREFNDERMGVKKRSGMSTTSKVAIGTGLVAAGALIVWLLTRKKK